MLPYVIRMERELREKKPWDLTSFIEERNKTKRARNADAESGLDDLGGLSKALEPIDRLIERRGKRLCSFKMIGACAATPLVVSQ